LNFYRIKIIKFHLLVELALFSIFFISPFLASSVSIEPKVEWDKTFGGPKDEYGWSVDLTADDGFIIACSTESYGSGSDDAWVIKTDSLGNIEWSKTFGGEKYDILYSLKQNPDGSYIGVGETLSFNSDCSDLWVIKLDSGGNMLWNKTFGDAGFDTGRSVYQTSEGDFIISGNYHDNDTDTCYLWIIKLDSSGNTIWSKKLEGTTWHSFNTITETSDKGYVVTGTTENFGDGKKDIWIIKLDSGGNIAWNKTFGGTNDDSSRSIAATNDGGCIILGNTGYYGKGESDGMLVKLNPEGVIEWNKTYGGADDDLGFAVEQTNDNGYIISGGTKTDSAGFLDLWVVKTDFKGNVEWTKIIGGTDYDGGYSIRQVDDNEYIICGTTCSYGEGKADIWLVKLGLEVLSSKTSSMSSIFSTITLSSAAFVIKLKKKK